MNNKELDMIFPYVENHKEFDGKTHRIYPQALTRLYNNDDDVDYFVLGYNDLTLPEKPFCITLLMKDKFGFFKIPLLDYDKFNDVVKNYLEEQSTITGKELNKFFENTSIINCTEPQTTADLIRMLNNRSDKKELPVWASNIQTDPQEERITYNNLNIRNKVTNLINNNSSVKHTKEYNKNEKESNIKKISIIKKYDEKTQKEVIDKIVVFNKDGQIEIQSYNRDKHLRLLANHLKDNGTTIKEAMDKNILSVINKDDEMAMDNLKKEIVEIQANRTNEIVSKIKIHEDNKKEDELLVVPISNDYRDLARYFRLSILRDHDNLTEKAEKEMKEIEARNERANAISNARKAYRGGNLSEKAYKQFLGIQREALREEINRVIYPEEKGKTR